MSSNPNIGFGKTEQLTNINFNNLKAGIKKADLKTQAQQNVFDKIDKNKNGILDQSEIDAIKNSLGAYASDGVVTEEEINDYMNSQGDINNVLSQDVLDLLNELGAVSENIENVENSQLKDGTATTNITYKPDASGNVVTDTVDSRTGNILSKTTKSGGKTVTQLFDQNGKVKQEITEENEVKTTVEYDSNGNIKSTIRQKAAVTEYIEDGKVVKKEKEKGNDIKDITEYEYDSNGSVSKTTTTLADGTKIIEEGNEVKTVARDGSYTVENKDTGEVKEFDKNGKEINSNEETKSEAFKAALGEKGSVTATIEGKATGLSYSDYTGQIRLPKGESMHEECFPNTLMMSLPDNNGNNAYVKLTLIDAENGVYETSAHDRNFQVTVGEDGSVTVKAANTDKLTNKLQSNLDKYSQIEEQKRAEAEQQQLEVERQVNEFQTRRTTITTQEEILQNARNSFQEQLDSDGWAGKTADAVSVLWGSDNRASKVEADLNKYEAQLKELSESEAQGETQFNAKFKEIYGIEYNSDNIRTYKENPTEENYKKAYGTTNDIASRVEKYNISQQKGASAVKTGVVIAGSAAAAVVTGGGSLVVTATVAATSTMATRVAVEFTDLATNNVKDDIDAQKTNEILNQAVKEGVVAGTTAGVLKGTGAMIGKVSSKSGSILISPNTLTEASIASKGASIASKGASIASKGANTFNNGVVQFAKNVTESTFTNSDIYSDIVINSMGT